MIKKKIPHTSGILDFYAMMTYKIFLVFWWIAFYLKHQFFIKKIPHKSGISNKLFLIRLGIQPKPKPKSKPNPNPNPNPKPKPKPKPKLNSNLKLKPNLFLVDYTDWLMSQT